MLFFEHINLKLKYPFIFFQDKHKKSLEYEEVFKKGANRISNYGIDFGLMLLNIAAYIPAAFIRIGIFKMSGVKIGKNSMIHTGCKFFSPKNVSIGEGTIIGQGAFLDGRDKITIGSHVDLASEVMIYNSQHDIDSEEFKATLAPVTIEDYVFVGPRAVILPGVTIGKGAVVAAGAVVTKDIKAKKLVAGVPAKEIRDRKSDLNYKLGRPRLFQ